jgi:hypothetical protein
MTAQVPSPTATTATTTRRSPTGAVVGTLVSVVVIGTTITWAFFSMRAVMGVGGSCADGGPYVSAQSCPDGSWLIAVAIPVMLLTAMFGSLVAMSVKAPNLLVLMWALLFGSLGWNFLEFGLEGGTVWGWLVCGVLFWLMAAPAVLAMLVVLKRAVVPSASSTADARARWWLPAYSLLLATGFLVGAWSYHAIS